MNPRFMATRHNRTIGHWKNLEYGTPCSAKKNAVLFDLDCLHDDSKESVRFQNLGTINRQHVASQH